MFLDASALVAILADEPEGAAFQEKLLITEVRITSALSLWEAAVAIARLTGMELEIVEGQLTAYVAKAGVEIMAIGEAEGAIALSAFARFGKGRHPARLNMGDCFAYACARSRGVPLLYKGEDFARTDIATA